MSDAFHSHRLPNGLTLVAEAMPWLRSAAFTLLIPAGTAREPEGLDGLCGIAVELAQRGAGNRDSRMIIETLDHMGVERTCAATTFHTSFSVAGVAETLPETLRLYADIIQRPHLPEDQLDESRSTALQEFLSLEDDPSQKVFTELKRLRYGSMYGRSPYGTEEGINSVEWSDVVAFHRKHYLPNHAILAVAGNFEWESLLRLVEGSFGDWKPGSIEELPAVEVAPRAQHIEHESSQTHIALAYSCVPYRHPEFYHSRGLISVLSDGMSSRLFTEVREKRGLVYAISASTQTLANRGSVLTYAGTTGERAQETLDVTVETINTLKDGVTPGELQRLQARVKSSLIMEQESSTSRSSQLASDWFYLQRYVSRDEVLKKIEALTCQSLAEHFERFPPAEWTLVSMGPEKVELPNGV